MGNLADIMQAIKTLVPQLPYGAIIETDTGKIPVNAVLEALVEQANSMVLRLVYPDDFVKNESEAHHA